MQSLGFHQIFTRPSAIAEEDYDKEEAETCIRSALPAQTG